MGTVYSLNPKVKVACTWEWAGPNQRYKTVYPKFVKGLNELIFRTDK